MLSPSFSLCGRISRQLSFPSCALPAALSPPKTINSSFASLILHLRLHLRKMMTTTAREGAILPLCYSFLSRLRYPTHSSSQYRCPASPHLPQLYQVCPPDVLHS